MKKAGLVIIAALLFALVIPGVYAEGFKRGKPQGDHDDAKNMFCRKAEMISRNKDELGLSNEQSEKIEALTIATKKDLIRAKAEIDIVEIDLKTEMKKDKIDMESVYKLIDKKYDLKKEKAKSTAAAISKLKEILTEEQKDKLKALCKSNPQCRHDKNREK